MPSPTTKKLLIAALASISMGSALAQTHTDHAAPVPSAPPASTGEPKPSMPTTDGGVVNHGSMDMGNMDMSGGDAPVDARDPHGYADGYVRGAGLYAGYTHLMMADEHHFASLLVDRLEWTHASSGNTTSYDAQAWFGNSYDKFLVKAEGEAAEGKVHDARTELLWSHAIHPYWDTQLGMRNDAGSGLPARNWLAFGVQGLAPYWFEVEATGYVGQSGRTALRLSAEYELPLTQKLILQPRLEANLYGKNDPELGVGRGLSDGAVGVRLRYEFTRQFAPYIGIERSESFGKTASYSRAAGERTGETRLVAGLRFWF